MQSDDDLECLADKLLLSPDKRCFEDIGVYQQTPQSLSQTDLDTEKFNAARKELISLG